MNNYFEASKGPQEIKEEGALNQIYKKVADEILKNNYRLDYKALKFIERFADKTGKSLKEITLDILERFNCDKGSLSGELEEKYISLAFDSAAIKKKMTADNYEFHQAAAAIALDIAKKGIILVDQGLIKKTVTAAEREMLTNEDETSQDDGADIDVV